MYCLLFVKWQTNWNWGYVDIKVLLSLDFQQFQQVDPVTVSLLWIYYVNRMTVQYRVVIEVDTEISTISVSYIYLSIKSLDVKCFMHTGTRSAKAIIVDWSALDQDQVRMGARFICCSISFQAEFFCHYNDICWLSCEAKQWQFFNKTKMKMVQLNVMLWFTWLSEDYQYIPLL